MNRGSWLWLALCCLVISIAIFSWAIIDDVKLYYVVSSLYSRCCFMPVYVHSATILPEMVWNRFHRSIVHPVFCFQMDKPLKCLKRLNHMSDTTQSLECSCKWCTNELQHSWCWPPLTTPIKTVTAHFLNWSTHANRTNITTRRLKLCV